MPISHPLLILYLMNRLRWLVLPLFYYSKNLTAIRRYTIFLFPCIFFKRKPEKGKPVITWSVLLLFYLSKYMSYIHTLPFLVEITISSWLYMILSIYLILGHYYFVLFPFVWLFHYNELRFSLGIAPVLWLRYHKITRDLDPNNPDAPPSHYISYE